MSKTVYLYEIIAAQSLAEAGLYTVQETGSLLEAEGKLHQMT